jgi:hypothetical protein
MRPQAPFLQQARKQLRQTSRSKLCLGDQQNLKAQQLRLAISLRKHLRQWLLRVLREFEDGQVTTHTHHLCDADAYELLPLFFTNYGQEEHDNSIFPIATNLFLCPAL